MASKKLRNQLAAQAWMAQAETDWRKEQEEKARQYKDAAPADPAHPAGYTEGEMYLRWWRELQNTCKMLEKIFHALAGLGFLLALQALILAAVAWKVFSL